MKLAEKLARLSAVLQGNQFNPVRAALYELVQCHDMEVLLGKRRVSGNAKDYKEYRDARVRLTERKRQAWMAAKAALKETDETPATVVLDTGQVQDVR